MKKTTELENKVIAAFNESDYGPANSQMWMWEIEDIAGLGGKVFSGVMSSLTKKGLINSDTQGDKGMMGMSIKDTYTINLTPEGLEILETLIPDNG